MVRKIGQIDFAASTDAADVERAIKELMNSLAPHSHTDDNRGRAAKAMMDVMPGFIRMLSRERNLFLGKMGKLEGEDNVGFVSSKDVDDHLYVVAHPIINMLVSAITTMVPCGSGDGKPPCGPCKANRMNMLGNICDNIFMCASETLNGEFGPDPKDIGEPCSNTRH
jgi:hypothetical protein